jgi:hypothetical protein
MPTLPDQPQQNGQVSATNATWNRSLPMLSTPSNSSWYLPSNMATARCPKVVTLSELVPHTTSSAKLARQWPYWGAPAPQPLHPSIWQARFPALTPEKNVLPKKICPPNDSSPYPSPFFNSSASPLAHPCLNKQHAIWPSWVSTTSASQAKHTPHPLPPATPTPFAYATWNSQWDPAFTGWIPFHSIS